MSERCARGTFKKQEKMYLFNRIFLRFSFLFILSVSIRPALSGQCDPQRNRAGHHSRSYRRSSRWCFKSGLHSEDLDPFRRRTRNYNRIENILFVCGRVITGLDRRIFYSRKRNRNRNRQNAFFSVERRTMDSERGDLCRHRTAPRSTSKNVHYFQ